MSHLTEEEISALQDSGLTRDAPYIIQGVRHGFFSVARHYGGAVYKGMHYAYQPLTDELIRDDVLKWLAKRRRVVKPKKEDTQSGLF